MAQLPIDEILPELRQTLTAGTRAVVQAPPGAGKTTRIPLALLDAPWLAGRSILMLEPRRLAARAAAAYMAAELGEAPGETVGYQVRFERRSSRHTRIEVVTEGILARRLQADPALEGVGLVIFDEFHERHLHGDLALALCLDSSESLREELRLLVMSATLDGQALADYLEAPLLISQGRQHPVTTHYLPRPPHQSLEEAVQQAVRRALAESEGDILLFLPGAGEIRRCLERLEADGACTGLRFHPLYGDLPLEAQARAIRPDPEGRRKLVLATNIAETSLTIEGVGVVIDSGLMRSPRFAPRSGLTRLETLRISRASAEQRAGRAGRLGPGVCYRLWGEGEQRGLIPFNPPEIEQADLAPLALELAAWGVTDAGQLHWLQAPPAGNLAQGRELLRELGALDAEGRISAAGRAMVALPLHPRLAHMLSQAGTPAEQALACDLAAIVSERDLFRGGGGQGTDLALRLEAVAALRSGGRGAARGLGADPGACAAVERSAAQFRRLLGLQGAPETAAEGEAGRLLALAYPDRIAQARAGGSGRYLMVNGRGARLAPDDPLATQPYLVLAHLDGQGREGQIRLAAPLELAQIEAVSAARIETADRVAWGGEGVVARRERRLGELVLQSTALDEVDPELRLAALLDGVARLGLEALPWSAEARQLQARVLCLRQWLPGEGWPDLSDGWLAAHLAEWLGPFLHGIGRREQLARLDLHSILRARLDYAAQQRLEAAAPERLSVPSGSRLRLEYSPDGEPPVLAVKLQELFGLADTPSVADGRVAVMLHLLSPARRPVQVTRDLRSFWERTYPEVRKELKGRYPKHPWPEDPWNAPPTARTKRRGA